MTSAALGAAVASLVGASLPAAADDEQIYEGQELRAPDWINVLGVWTASWRPDAIGGDWSIEGIEWSFHFSVEPSFEHSVNRRLRFARDTGGAFGAFVRAQQAKTDSTLELVARHANSGCPTAENALKVGSIAYAPRVQNDDPRSARGSDLPRFPHCGERMVSLVEDVADLRFQTCVDRAQRTSAYLSMLTMVFRDDRLEWVWSPGPFPLVEIEGPPRPIPWSVPPSCHPLFPEVSEYEDEVPRRSIAFELAWAAPDQILASQVWIDDRETGSYLSFYPGGELMTVGYRIDGQQHGIWWYLAPDGTLLEARLYALGVELEQLPVETVRTRR